MSRRLVGVVVVLTACAVDGGTATAPDPVLNLDAPPRTVFMTDEFEVGELYTVGSTDVPQDVARPFVITGIDVLVSANIEIVGRGVFQSDGEAIGLMPGWPPETGSGRLDLRAIEDGTEWTGDVSPILGVRTMATTSGLRGVVVSWIDGDGNRGSRTFDFAVLTCAPGACDGASSEDERLLEELGLLDP